jgi:2-polyprenyl-3-methyl-5-hydroxy-6-metoxy-1,4-benzoquinol methylase
LIEDGRVKHAGRSIMSPRAHQDERVQDRREARDGSHVCPVWVARLLASPLRRLLQNPAALLAPHVRSGQTVLDAGCGAGFYTLPMARLTGREGRVIAVDLQPELIADVQRRARRAGLSERIEGRACTALDLGLADLAGQVHFALVMHVLHEAPDPGLFMGQVLAALAPGARCLLAEPSRHLTVERFRQERELVQDLGFRSVSEPRIRFSRAVLLERGRA